jgi:hypothetical protein
LRDLKKFGHAQAFSVFADYLARSADLGDLSMVASLIGDLRELGARAAIDVLIERIEQVRTLKGVGGVPELINELRVLAAFKAVSVLGEAMQGLDFSALEQPGSLGGRWPDVSYHHRVLRQLDGAGARDAASALALRLARAFPLDNLWATSDLVAALRDAKAEAAVQALHDRIACMTSVTNPWGIDRLIAQMREAGGQTALQALFRLAEAIPLTTPDSMTQVLHSLRLAGGIESARILAGRVAEIFQLDTKYNMENLVDELRAIDATDAVAAVQRFSEEQRQTWETRERAPRNREFHPADLLYVSIDRSELPGARYGYEPNGTPSLAWGWHSLA